MRRRVAPLLVLAALCAVATALFVPAAQDPAYHAFADGRTLLGVPNGLDVLTNAAFVLAGAFGLCAVASVRVRARAFEEPGEAAAWALLFASVLLTGFGSAYYHLAPDDGRLFWDRLPMATGFGALLSVAIAERVDRAWGRRLLVPLVAASAATVLAWGLTGDVRPYAFLQGYAALALLLLVVAYPPRTTRGGAFALLLAAYAVAKALETADGAVLSATGGLASGHSLKHVVAAAGVLALAVALATRRPLRSGASAAPGA